MALPTSGNPIKFSEIESEFGGSPNNNLGAYRISAETYGGKSFSTLDTGIPSSGTIKFGDFHGKKLNVVVDCHTDCANTRVNARTEYNNNNVNCVGSGTLTSPAASRNASDSSGHKVFIRVNKTIGSASGSVDNCALRTGSFESGTSVALDVGGSGKIIGAGGPGGDGGEGNDGGNNGDNGGDGTSALGIEYNGTAVSIEGGGLIVCGFGGGGGGGGGRDEDTGSDARAGGGGGGGGAGFPVGVGGEGASGNSDSPGVGGEGGNGSVPAGGEQGGAGGSSSSESEASGGAGGRGGDQENGAGTGSGGGGGEENGEGGTGGANGSAIRKSSDEIGYTLSGSTGGGSQANTGAESGGGSIGVS